MTPIPAGWKLVEALRESLLWTASSLAAVGKEQDVITLEGRKRTIGEILDEANAALDAPSPASVAPGDAQDEQPKRNGCGSVSFKLSDGSAVSCDWSTHEWELSIPATRHERDIAFKELLQEIGRLRASVAAPAAGDARKELTPEQIEAGWHQTFSTSNPYCPCNLKSFTKAVRWAECAIAAQQVQQQGEA